MGMIKKLLPMLFGLIGLGAGVGAGFFLRPAPTPAPVADSAPADPTLAPEFAKMANQFIVPVMDKGKVAAMVIMTLSLQVKKGSSPQVYNVEPKLRDTFLQVMFDHANAGGFSGTFTDAANLILLRKALLEAAKSVLGAVVTDVLIVDIARQDS